MGNGFHQWVDVAQALACKVETRLDLRSAGLKNAGTSAGAAGTSARATIRLRG
jgi:hypothetical protein